MCNKCNGTCNSCNCTCNKPCLTPDCACKVFIGTDCVTMTEDLECSNIVKGQTTTEVLKLLDKYICDRFETVENFFQIVNVGNGAGVYKGVSVLGKRELKSLVGDGTITITPGTDTINFSVNFPPGVNQDNFIKYLEIDGFDVAEHPFPASPGQLINYLNAIIPADRLVIDEYSTYRIGITLNIVGEYDDPFYLPRAFWNSKYITIFEIKDIGKGVLPDLTEDNIVLVYYQEIRKDVIGTDTIIQEGSGISLSGDGSELNPYIITSSVDIDGSETKINAGTNISVIGNGTIATPYIISSSITPESNQKIITYPTDFTGTNYTLLSSDHNKLIIVKNTGTNVTITVPTGLVAEHFTALLREGTGEIAVQASGGNTINSFDGLRINGRYQQVALDREGSTTTFYLTGNTKV